MKPTLNVNVEWDLLTGCPTVSKNSRGGTIDVGLHLHLHELKIPIVLMFEKVESYLYEITHDIGMTIKVN